MLTTTDHRRDRAGLTYVYPVLSRRSGGLSIGVNLNPNNACNWRCVYCQVPGLRRGSAPQTDLERLGQELRGFIDDVLHGDFYSRFQVPEEQRIIRDIAISGNGEPTSAPAFDRVVELIGAISEEFGLVGIGEKRRDTVQDLDVLPPPCPPPARGRVQNSMASTGSSQYSCPPGAGEIKLVLITNGSLVRRESVRHGLERWGEWGGEIWFKLDSATESGIRRINGYHLAPETLLRNLEAAATLCPTWLQTCLFAFDGKPPSDAEKQAYLEFLTEALNRKIPLKGILLYGLARPSLQMEAPRLSALPAEWLEAFAETVRETGLETRLSL
ncbi:MAG: radical SAM protein [Methylococcaceae bacterium]|nr:radical SAM protein [Methylococcaceae bacterium]